MLKTDTAQVSKTDHRITVGPFILLFAIALVVVFFIDKFTFRSKTVDPSVWLGVETVELTPTIKQQYDVQAASGVLVSRIFNGSPAQASGIKEGDIIRRWNGISVTGPQQLEYLIQTTQLSERITITMERQGKPVSVYALVGVRPGGI